MLKRIVVLSFFLFYLTGCELIILKNIYDEGEYIFNTDYWEKKLDSSIGFLNEEETQETIEEEVEENDMVVGSPDITFKPIETEENEVTVEVVVEDEITEEVVVEDEVTEEIVVEDEVIAEVVVEEDEVTAEIVEEDELTEEVVEDEVAAEDVVQYEVAEAAEIKETEKGIESINKKIDDLANLIKNSDPISNPSTPKDHIINAYLFNERGNLLKAQSSFETYFNLTKQYKVDVLLDYAKVLESNEGYSSVKYFFENLKQKNNNNGIIVSQIIYTSNSKVSLAKDLMKLQKEDMIFRWALLTLKVDTFFEILGFARYDEPEFESYKTLYYNTLNKSVENHLEIGCDFKMVRQYFLNTQKAKELVFSNKMNNVPGYYNWFANKDDKLDFNTFNKLKEMGCYRN